MNAAKIAIACDKCGKKFGVDAALAGRAVKCPCGNVLKVAARATETVAAPQATTAKPSAPKSAAPNPAVPKPAAPKATTPKPATPTPNAAAPQAAVPQKPAAAPVPPAFQNNLLDQLTEADFNRKAVNPYSPPTSTSNDAAALRRFGVVDDELQAAAKQATGNITFLAVLNFIGATLYLGAGVLLLALTSVIGTVADVLPIAAIGALAAGVLMFFGVFDLVSGIGLIKRTKWGWWLCVTGLSWAFFDRGFGVAIRFMYTNDWSAEIPKAIGGVVFMLSSFYFLHFMCQNSTMKMFKLNTHPGLVWAIVLTFGLLFGGLGFGAAIYGMRQAAAGG